MFTLVYQTLVCISLYSPVTMLILRIVTTVFDQNSKINCTDFPLNVLNFTTIKKLYTNFKLFKTYLILCIQKFTRHLQTPPRSPVTQPKEGGHGAMPPLTL